MNRTYQNLYERFRARVVGSWQDAHSMVDYALQGRQLTPQEAMALREMVERAGLPHVPDWTPPTEHKCYPPLKVV
jgi:hypothetical protein